MTSNTQRSFLVNTLQLLGLTAFALSQPLYNLLGNSVEFFVAHRASEWNIVTFVLIISLGIPLSLIALEAIVGLVSRSARAALHLFLISLLIAVFAIGMLNRVIDADIVLACTTSIVLAAVLGFMVWRGKALGDMISILGVGALIFPLQFLLFSPASHIHLNGAPVNAMSRNTNSTPIVFVIFDEFNPIALLDGNDEVDDVRFPNISALADISNWYPNAASIHPQTIKSVPALMTGLVPLKNSIPPTLNSYPKNIFTLLGSQYRMNIRESVTRLCPDIYCPQMRDAQSLFDSGAFVSDILIIFAHIVLPPTFAAQHLPSLEEGWHNFGRGRADPKETRKTFVAKAAESRRRSRAADFRAFLTSMELGRGTLDFIHILLPHDIYQYLPDGKEYIGASTAGGNWPDDQTTVDVAYQRYLLQLGMLDNLVGELFEKLEQNGKFNEAMIIVVADHGRVFRAGESKRGLTDDVQDVLHIPMFIKFPNQKRGKRDNAFVSTIDILPTIAEVVGADVSWTFDGESLFSKKPMSNLTVAYKGLEYNLTKYSVVKRDAIPNRLEKFGSGTSLNDLVLSTIHDDLLGLSLAGISLERNAENTFQIEADVSNMLRIDRPEFIKPVLVAGLVRTVSVETDLWVGIVMNGTVAALAPVERVAGRLQFSSVLPPSSVVAGANNVEFFVVGGTAMARTLHDAGDWQDESYEIITAPDGRNHIRNPEDRAIKIVPAAVNGLIYARTESRKGIHKFWGWAAELSAKEPAEYVLLFVNDKFANFAQVREPSPGVVKVYGDENLGVSGFQFEIPQVVWNLDPNAIKAFAISKSGKATEMTRRGILDPNQLDN